MTGEQATAGKGGWLDFLSQWPNQRSRPQIMPLELLPLIRWACWRGVFSGLLASARRLVFSNPAACWASAPTRPGHPARLAIVPTNLGGTVSTLRDRPGCRLRSGACVGLKRCGQRADLQPAGRAAEWLATAALQALMLCRWP